ncbi:hypothetical protein C1645_748416 [Glomus cerebriforme]|uniref:BTB domain-containing protein n=1 Tax=Glomus cerebriforme TaxID=658196 RepID=A0A397TQP4_9GLOM|nr:hypothetical protein C1645_748416 [Glomus cerebriforme]
MTTSPNSSNSPPPSNPPAPSNPSPQPSTKSSPKSLENDLRQLLYDDRFFDISLKCSDGEILRACKNILATRTEVFNELIFDKSKKNVNQHQQLEFNNINSVAMKLILEYLYTSKNEKETLNVNNIIEVYYSAIYFKLDDLQDDIIEFTKKELRDGDEELGKKLLSEFIEKFSLQANNKMGTILVDWVAKMQLFPDNADNDSLSLMGLQYLLNKTYGVNGVNKPFATYEITLFEYTLIKTKQIILEEEIGSKKDPYYMNYDSDVIERIKERLNPLLEYIDLCIIDPDDVVGKLEPLKIFPQEMITKAYRHQIKIKHETLQPMRGHLIFKWKNFDKESESKLCVINNGFTVEANSELKPYKSGDKGFHGWALGSDGYVYNKKGWQKNNASYWY